MGRRLSPLIAGIGLIGALAWFGLGATLRQPHDELCQKYPSKDIRFRLAFDNGKAAIRFVVA